MDRGFTLIEMLVALAIMGLIGAIGWPAMEAGIAASRQRAAVSGVILALTDARAQAIKSGNPVRLAIGPDARSLTEAQRVALALPQGVTLKASRADLAFFDDGTALPAVVTVASGKRASAIQIDALIGIAERDR